ncbi:MAG: Na+/H+ antiporter subunit E [Desulfobacterales bacterium]|nr:Na+/H+ antiporter subunit E [Desulfobacterales bacterium]
MLSGNFSGLLLGLGFLSSLLVAWFSHDLIFTGLPSDFLGIFFRFSLYIPWLIWEIVKANFNILKLIFHPRMKEKIQPHIVTFETGLTSDLAITTLANSITLTPGTITVTANSDGQFRVHAIDLPSAQALPGAMLEKVAHIFGEKI